MKSLRRLALAAGTAAALLYWSGQAWAQCAMCRAALVSSPEGRALAEPFNRAILLMLVAPYLVAGAVAALALRARVRAAVSRLARRLAPR
jgi:uncharacterized membrane protein